MPSAFRKQPFYLHRVTEGLDTKIPSQTSFVELHWNCCLFIDLLLFQADVEISFSIPIATLEQAEDLESSWSNSQEICRQKASSANSTGVGPFGLLVLASNTIEEYTAVFFRIFKKNDKFVVLMGCDQKRYLLNSS